MRNFMLALVLMIGLLTAVAPSSPAQNRVPSPVAVGFDKDMTWHLLQSTVRVRRSVNMDGGGASGVVIFSGQRDASVSPVDSRNYTYIVTCGHVAGIQSKLYIDSFSYQNRHNLTGIRTVQGTVVKVDFALDLALVEVVSFAKFTEIAPLIKIDDFAKMELNDLIAVVGCALADHPIATYGNVTGFAIEKMHINAPIIFGNSGGGVFDERGRLVGISQGVAVVGNSFGDGHPITHMGIAVPANVVDIWLRWSEFSFLVGDGTLEKSLEKRAQLEKSIKILPPAKKKLFR